MIEYYLQSFPEAVGLFQGLEFQAMLRSTSLGRWLPYLFVLCGSALLWLRLPTHRPVAVFSALLVYLVSTTLLTALFWPEFSRFGRGRFLTAAQIASAPAFQDPQATAVTAAETGEVQTGPILQTPGFRWFLGFLIETPLAFARVLNPHAHQVFRPMQSISWFMGLQLTADVTRGLQDWIEGCYKPVIATPAFQGSITSVQLLPWGEGAVAQALRQQRTVPGASTGGAYLRGGNRPLGLLFLSAPGSSPEITCDLYLKAVELDVQQWLSQEKSPGGVPLLQVFQEDLGLSPDAQGKHIVYREMLKLIGSPAAVPSLAGAYGAASGANAVRGALSGAVTGALGGAAGGINGAGWGALIGGVTGLFGAINGQFAHVTQVLTDVVGLAMVFIHSVPFVFGKILMMLVGFFPIPFLYMLTPFAGLRPLFNYVLALLYVTCSPLWLALVDLWMRSDMALAPQSQDPLQAILVDWAPAQIYAARAVVLGLVIVYSMGGVLFFSLARGVVGNIAGAVRGSQS